MLFNRKQYTILSERYFECLLGDFTSLVWMVGQAPLIALIVIMRWQSWQATETLHFVMALTAVWFGCINACREIAKERTIYQRERLFGLNLGAYLASKVKILSLIGLVEIGLFYFLLEQFLDLNVILVGGFLSLFVLYLSGMCLGLFLSRWCRTTSNAVIAVPIAVIPQIVFSKFMLPQDALTGWSVWIEKIMIVKWGFEGLRYCQSGETAWFDFGVSMIMLMALGGCFLLLTLFHLWFFAEES